MLSELKIQCALMRDFYAGYGSQIIKYYQLMIYFFHEKSHRGMANPLGQSGGKMIHSAGR
jgi:hypothetical protein